MIRVFLISLPLPKQSFSKIRYNGFVLIKSRGVASKKEKYFKVFYFLKKTDLVVKTPTITKIFSYIVNKGRSEYIVINYLVEIKTKISLTLVLQAFKS